MLPFLPPPVVFQAPAAALSPQAQAVLDQAAAWQKRIEAARKASGAKAEATYLDALKQDIASLDARLKTETDPGTRQALLVARLDLGHYAHLKATPDMLAQARKEIPPTSRVWGLEPNLIPAVTDLGNDKNDEAYLAEARDKNPLPEVRRTLLFYRVMDGLDAKDDGAWKPALAKLESEFPKSQETAQAEQFVAGAQKTAVGAAVPAFQMPSLEDPKVVFTNDTFKGKYLLIDFWATWCGPCRQEMPALHAAYAKFHPKGLEVLSLSFDVKASDIAPFRKDPAHPLPWNHAFVEGGFESPLAKAFGVNGIPKPVLVGPDGKILATEGELRGEDLEKTLAKYLGAN